MAIILASWLSAVVALGLLLEFHELAIDSVIETVTEVVINLVIDLVVDLVVEMAIDMAIDLVVSFGSELATEYWFCYLGIWRYATALKWRCIIYLPGLLCLGHILPL